MADTGSYECDLSNGDSMVIDVYLVEKHSDSDCTFFNGPPSNAPQGGGWKRQGNSIFVVEGCRGTFQYCTPGTVLPVKSDSDVLFYLQSNQDLIIDGSFVY